MENFDIAIVGAGSAGCIIANQIINNSNYRRIRAFFNFIGENVDAYPKRLLNNMPFKKPKITTETFTSVEIQMVKQFIDEKDPANNCLDTAIITDPKLMTKRTKEKLQHIAGRVFKKK
mgnify:CR=1 FL=1